MSSKSIHRNDLLLRCVFVLAVFAADPMVTTAPAVVVKCAGNACGSSGPRNYYYWVFIEENEKFDKFMVGTCDLNWIHYSDFVQPQGWGAIFVTAEPGAFSHKPMTAHGGDSPGPQGKCPGYIYWYGPDLTKGVYYFGYNNPNPPHDVGFKVSLWDEQQGKDIILKTENWDKPVGAGEGPVHGPVPEPATVLMLGLGSLAMLRRQRRHID